MVGDKLFLGTLSVLIRSVSFWHIMLQYRYLAHMVEGNYQLVSSCWWLERGCLDFTFIFQLRNRINASSLFWLFWHPELVFPFFLKEDKNFVFSTKKEIMSLRLVFVSQVKLEISHLSIYSSIKKTLWLLEGRRHQLPARCSNSAWIPTIM
jgi:hypothetical protein